METRLKALAEASARIFSARSLDDTLRLITEAARELVGAHMSVTSLTLNEDWAQVIVSASLSDKYAAWRGYEAKPSGKGIYTRVCAENRPMRLTQAELEAHPAFENFGAAKGRHPPLRGWLAAPLAGRDGVNLGLIQLSDKNTGEFDAADEAILVQLARLAALAVENQRLVEAAQAAERRFEAFATLANEVLWETDAEHRYTLFRAKDSFRMNSAPQAYLGKTRWAAALADPGSPLWAAHIADLEAHRPIRNFEYQVPRRDGSIHYLRVSADPMFDAAGKFLGYRGATQNVTDLRRAEAAAKANEARFQEFARIGSDILWETDAEHRYTEVAASHDSPVRLHIAAILGKTRWEYLGADLNDAAWQDHLADLAARRPFRNFEYTTRKHGDRESRLRVSGSPVFAADGSFRGYRGTTQDITDLRAAEAAARASEERFRKFAEIASDWLWETDAEHRFTFFGGAAGTTPDQRPYGMTRWELVGADLADPKWRAHLADLVAGRPFRNFEYTRIDTAGRTRHITVSGEPVRAPNGTLAGYRGTASDITARREAEGEAKKAAEQYRSIVETANEGVWILDKDARTVFVNPRMAEMMRYAPDELLGRSIYDFRPAEDRDQRARRWSAREQGIAEQREARFVRRDGSIFVAHISAAPMKDASGAFAGALGMVTDITERKKAEAALNASEDRFRDFAEMGSDWLWETDAEHRVTLLDGPGDTRAKGFALGKKRWDYGNVDPESPEWRRHRRDLDLRLPFRNFTYKMVDSEGGRRFFSISGKPVFGADGAFVGYRGITRDVTPQHEADARLRASETRFRDFAAVASDWMWETDAEHRFNYFTPSRDQSQPDSSNAAIGKTRWGFAGADLSDPKWQAHIADLDAHRPFHHLEYQYRRPDGTAGTYVVSGVPVFGEDGTFTGYRGTTTDITARRAAEAAARATEQKYRHIVETAHEGIWMLDAERRTSYVNPRMAEMLGYAPAEMLGRHHWDFMTAEDRAQAIEATRQRPGDGVEKVELRYLRKDGSPIWVIVTSNVVDDPATGTQAVLGMVSDITDRRAAEEQAARAKREVDAILTSISDGFVAVDNEWRFTYVNAAAERIVGRSARELLGQSAVDTLEDSIFTQSYRAAKAANEPAFFTAYSAALGIWLENRAYPHADGLTIFFRDVTAERLSHRALAASERKFRQFIETANEGLWITDRDARIVFANRRVEELLGYEPGELVGMSIFDTVPPDRLEEVRNHRHERQTGKMDRFEARHMRKDGSEISVLLSLTPLHDEEGAFIGSCVMFVDISAQQRVQAALEESEAKLRGALESNESILASISDGFVALDNEWRFTFINPAAERMWNRKAGDLLGRTIFNSLQVDPDNPFHSNYLASKQSGEPVAFTAYSDMFGKWLEVRGYPHAGGYTLFFDDITDERRSHRALIKSQKKLEAAREMNERIFETSLDLICITDRNGDFLQVNPGTCQQFGYPLEELVGHNASEFIHPDGIEATRRALRDARTSKSQHTFENRCRRKDGQLVPMNWSVAWSESEQKYFLIGRDMSERIEAQERLNRSQRLEAIGQLTGGIAHDFNNLLTVIMGNSDTLARGLKENENLRRRAELSLEAARRAAELTSQLLAFARRQTLAPKAVDANRLVRELHELMQRSLGAQVEIDFRPGAGLWLCKVDSTQLETALLNLALNARDAMPGGGRLTIAAANHGIAPGDQGRFGDLAAGDYVAIAVADTGTGMAPEVLARAFEPFFTTKDIGKGSGLGLAMVYGFVKQSGGHAAIESKPGQGTKVTLYLPRAKEDAAAKVPATGADGAPLPGGGETILVVEDDAAVRELVTDQLRNLGYRVLVAGNGPTARNILYAGEKVDLLFTDVMMPGGINGAQLAEEAERQLPGLKVLFTTGYSDVPSLKRGRGSVSLLRKPYKTRDLAQTVRQVLDSAS